MPLMSRRTFLLATGTGAVAGLLKPALANTTGAMNFSGILVDVSQMRERGFGIQADWVQQDLVLALKQQFAGRLTRNAPRLLVQVSSVSLGTFTGNSDKTSDFMDGRATILDKANSVLAYYPMLLNLPSSSGGAWYLPDVDRGRVRALSVAFARWVERKTG